MSVENWIDAIAALAGEVTDENGRKIRSYQVYGKAEFPESLTVFPCAVSYTTGVAPQYSESGPHIDLVRGVTEFHLAADMKRGRLPGIMKMYGKIRQAFAGHMTLGGKVAYMMLDNSQGEALQGPVGLTYGTEQQHWGIVARWQVKEVVVMTLGR